MKRLILFLNILFLTAAVAAYGQDRVVTGVVTTSDDGSTVPGVSVSIKGTSRGATTDADGKYRISVPSGNVVLVFTSIGFQKQEIEVANKSVIDVKLINDSSELSEVVVIGYGTQSKRDATGSIGSVSGAKLAQMPNQSFESGLAGRTPGVQITVPSGVLNAPPVFRIRGTNSISLSSYPLVIVDGVPTFTGNYSAGNASSNPLASINPNDIESIDVAKDAAATAIYGSRAANGVVFITTKRGKSGKVRVSYDGWAGISNTYRMPELLNAQEYLTFKRMAIANNPNARTTTLTQTNDANGNPIDTKWQDQVYRQGVSHSHNLNVSGGSETTNYYFSTGYTNQQGIIRRNDFERLNALFNVDSKLSKAITIGGKISYSNEKNLAATSSGSLSGEAFSSAGLGRLAIVLPPILAPYNNDGSLNINAGNAAIGSSNNMSITNLSYYNPVALLNLNRSNSEVSHIQSNAYIQLNPVKGLTLKSSYGIDYMLVDNDIFWSPLTGDGFSTNGNASGIFGKYKTWLWTNTAQYDRSFGGAHNFSLLIGQEQQRNTSRGFGLNRQSIADRQYTELQAGWNNNNPTNLVYGENYLLSVFGRLNYNYKEKYYLSGNLRQDEYSALGEKKGVFWGASAGWEITQENFWKNAKLNNIFSSFKIRGSYGKVGNIGGVNDYSPYSLYGSGYYGGLATLGFSTVGNPTLKWETSTKTDVGLNFGLFNDRITGEVAYYYNNINNLILYVAQAPSAGLPSNPPQNVGTMFNKGLELALNARIIQTNNFQWTSNFNITFNKNEVSSLAPGMNVLQTGTSGLETVNQSAPGYSLGQLWVVRTAGVDPTTGKRIFVNSQGQNVYYQYYVPSGQYNYSTTPDGRTRYVSPTGGTSITQADDAVMYANVIPKQYGGWDNNFKFKNFDLGVMLTYQLGFNVYYGTNAGLHDQRWWNNARDVLTEAWMQEGDTGKKYAKPVFNDNVSNGSAMPLDINVFRGDFLKLRNVTFGYTLPSSLLTKVKMSNLRVYVSGQNLAVLTKYPGPDPEVSSNGLSNSSQGVDRNTVGNTRTFTVGLKAGF
ncbi:TonB-dependent receptor [Siphonobacter sp. SORGH_AS_1065]|uniref:SusC/RagA family TonB-linked outer membrane protein n=1 Tax=Siphonobacter sp. SORGH_AS_1065 TaxID=3041795 RepID=UPI0027854A5F|nr:TonB-dependent receptor [Siphonobacter sp. SORGH_AS_1065]MDQ1087214.1 TonB-linked SusC/RagA family outer membrane protein [Siphonobacter sp. SORGH_AS_1065]